MWLQFIPQAYIIGLQSTLNQIILCCLFLLFSPMISQVLLNVYFVPGSISELEIYHPVKETKVLILGVHVLN